MLFLQPALSSIIPKIILPKVKVRGAIDNELETFMASKYIKNRLSTIDSLF